MQDTRRFCRHVLTRPDVQQFMEANFVCWAGTVTQREAFQLASLMRTATYPFVAVLARSGSQVRTTAGIV